MVYCVQIIMPIITYTNQSSSIIKIVKFRLDSGRDGCDGCNS